MTISIQSKYNIQKCHYLIGSLKVKITKRTNYNFRPRVRTLTLATTICVYVNIEATINMIYIYKAYTLQEDLP
jgi:hypothetical protein